MIEWRNVLQFYAAASIGQFLRMGYDMHTLHPNDKAVIRWLHGQIS